MYRTLLIPTMALAAGLLLPRPAAANPEMQPAALSLPELEQRVEAIDTELARLARLSLRSGVGNIGWISDLAKNATTPVWAEIDLPANTLIDQVVLAPVLWNDAAKGPQADGFPEAFEIIAGVESDTKGRVIARIGPDDRVLPRIAPLAVPVTPTPASWVRVQSTRLVPHARNAAGYRFKLSEIMVFSGERNVALHRPVRVKSTVGGWGAAAIFKEALVDGLTPYLMDAATGERSNPYMAMTGKARPFSFTLDLADSYPVNGLRIHAADVNEYIPQINRADFGMPTRLLIQGASRADFQEAVPLLDYQRTSPYQAGNIMEWRIPETDCRYIRVTVPASAWPLDAANNEFLTSFAEVEILAKEQNVAKGKTVQFPRGRQIRHSATSALTDGRNHFGAILPMRTWMEELARRHDLEQARPPVAAELALRYAKQQDNLRRMTWLAVLLTAGIVIIILLEKVVRQRAVFKARRRIAANLHDELGANLHAIGMLGDLARAETGASERLKEIVARIRALTERSGRATRSCTQMLESKNLCDDLIEEMKSCSYRLTADIEHTLSFQGEAFIRRLKPKKSTDLFLFYKECLTNILRHSEASRISTCLEVDGKGTLKLILTDNGKGVTEMPPSLKRRAKLLRAKLTLETPSEGGTVITLQLRNRRMRKLRESG